MTHNRDVAAALGRVLWSTGHFVPQYRSGEIGSWRIDTGGQLVNDWGYHSGPCLLEMLPSLARRIPSTTNVDDDGWATWMSLTPLEVESQELGFLHASGNAVVMGLGMGWVAANSALNPKVSHVTVVERDPDVIRLFYDSGALESLPLTAQQKIEIVTADALDWRPDSGTTVDFLYADIWLHLAEADAMRQVRRLQEHIQADAIYFWGQELAIYSAIQEEGQGAAAVTADSIRRAVTDVIGLPLLIPHDRDYARMIEQVVRHRIDRRLPVSVSFGRKGNFDDKNAALTGDVPNVDVPTVSPDRLSRNREPQA